MVDAAPFAALRYDAAVAGPPAATSAPAYDDLERFTYARHRTASPYTVLELLASDPSDDPYRAAGAAFQRWLRTGVLTEEPAPAFYRYDIHELRGGTPTVVRGLLAAVAVGDGQLLEHEAVDPQRVASRRARMVAVPADLAPLYAIHPAASPELRRILDAAPTVPPLVAMTDEEGADHRIWPIAQRDLVATLRRELAPLRAVIADGHHRHAAAVEQRHADPRQLRTLTYLVDGSAHAPRLRAVHRLTPMLPRDFWAQMRAAFEVVTVPPGEVEAHLDAAPVTGHVIGLVAGGRAWLLTARPEAVEAALPQGRSTAWRTLDAAVFDALIRPHLGAGVEYRSDRPSRASDLPAEAGFFVLRPPSLDIVYACAAAGDTMPAKTTLFRPKPRAGLLLRSLHSGHDHA